MSKPKYISNIHIIAFYLHYRGWKKRKIIQREKFRRKRADIETTVILAREKNVDSKLLGELKGDLGFKYKKEREEERTIRMMGRVSNHTSHS